MRGGGGISISQPPYFSENPITYYNIDPFENLSEAELKEFFKEYNPFTVKILNIHEAIPGHYFQGAIGRKCPIPSFYLFSDMAFVEGWAVYSENLMLENGYSSNELEFYYKKWFQRILLNTIIDYEIHCKNTGKDEIIRKLVEDGFQQTYEAIKKYERAIITSHQLCSYFAGFTELMKLRELALKKKMSLKDFHKILLENGALPPHLLSHLFYN